MQSMATTGSTALVDDGARQEAVAAVLQSLTQVKGWLRDAGREVHPERSTSELLVLSLVERYGPARIGSLAEHARVDISVISRQAQHLERLGLVRREVDPCDGRAHLVRISRSGALILAEGRGRLAGRIVSRLDTWPTDTLVDFAANLQRLLDDIAWETPGHATAATTSTPAPEETPR